MRFVLVGLVLIGLGVQLARGDEPLVEKYLQTGELAQGQHAVESALAKTPDDDQLRFSLAVVQLLRGVERLGQSLYEYGCVSESAVFPLIRLPIPKNSDPSTITHADYRRMVDGFYADLQKVESTLAEIKSDDVQLPLRMASIRLDLVGDRTASERLVDILKRLMPRDIQLPADNPDFRTCFDRGDVAWLRAYCHLLMSIIDLGASVDTNDSFDLWADSAFPKPKPRFTGTEIERRKKSEEMALRIKVCDPVRMRHFRLHFLKVCELNRETWKHIRAETDNDNEWLPNPKQTGVLRMPVTEDMIDAWLKMIAEVESLLEGTKGFPAWVVQICWNQKTEKKLNFRAFLDDPPEIIDNERARREGVREKYLDANLPDIDIGAFLRVFSVFQNSLAVGYAAWFN